MSDRQVRGQYTRKFKLEAVRQVKAGQSMGSTARYWASPKARAEQRGTPKRQGSNLDWTYTRTGKTPLRAHGRGQGLIAERRSGELLKELYRATPAEAGAKGNAARGKHAPASPADASLYHQALSDTCVSPRAASRESSSGTMKGKKKLGVPSTGHLLNIPAQSDRTPPSP